MKTKIFKSFLTLIVYSLIFIGCSGDDDSGSSGNGDGSFTALVDGTAFEAFDEAIGASISGSAFIVQGSDKNGNAIRLNVVNYNGTGTYKTGDNIANVNSANYITLSPVGNWSSTFNIGSGTINVTSIANGFAEGTFTFSGYNAEDKTTKNVTDGKFKAKIQ